MHFLLLLTLITNNQKSIEVRFTEVPPRIDGQIEEIWSQADSISDFIQSYPDEATEPNERTVVYVLQDNNNLFVAFRCYASKHPPVAQLYGMEEEATLDIDPMDWVANYHLGVLYTEEGREEDGQALIKLSEQYRPPNAKWVIDEALPYIRENY
jgi:hypothetical protein